MEEPRKNINRRFEKRLKSNHFNLEFLNELKYSIEQQLFFDPTDISYNYQLALLHLQSKPTITDINRVVELIDMMTIEEHSIYLPRIERLSEIVSQVRLNIKTESIKQIDRINWSIYNKCPMHCPGCYNGFMKKQLSIKECKEVLYKIDKVGVKNLIVSGGDPFMWKGLLEFISYSSNLNINLGIDTVAYNLDENLLSNISKHIKYIGIPLDSLNTDIQTEIRISKYIHLDSFKRSIDLLMKSGVSVKINTMVSNLNLDTIGELALYINDNYSNVYWSIFEWIPLRSTALERKKFGIESKDFKNKIHKIKTDFPNLNITVKEKDNRSFTHVLIQNDGSVITFGCYPEEVFYIGNILQDEFQSIISSPLIDKKSSKFKEVNRFH